jgi:HK97 family phage major capsid protein
MTILQIKQLMAGIVDKNRALLASVPAGSQLSAEQTAELEANNKLFAELETKLAMAQEVERQAVLSAHEVPAMQGQTVIAGAQTQAATFAAPAIHTKKAAEQYKGSGFARTAMAIAAANNNLADAAKFAETEIGDKNVAMALTTANGSGGALVPEHYMNEVIELLRPRTVVRQLGARTVPLRNGSATFPRQTGGAQSNYKGEAKRGTVTDATFGDVKLSAKTQITLVAMSNELIGYAGYNVEQLVLNDCITEMATRLDKAVLRDDGTNETPVGFSKFAADNGKLKPLDGAADISDLRIIDAYLDSLILELEESDSKMVSVGWAMAPRTYNFLAGLLTPTGARVYPELQSGMLKGMKAAKTTQIPRNLGAGGALSEIYLADWNDVLIGETGQFEIALSREATYVDGNGDTQSAFQNNMSLLRIVTGNDVGFRHIAGLVKGTDVKF